MELARHLLVQPGHRRRGLPHGLCSSCPRPRIARTGGIDWIGIVLGALALATVSFAIIQGEQSGYLTWWIDLFFALSVVFGVAFFFVEHRVRRPILDLSLFRKAPFSGSVFVAFAAYFGTFSIFFFTALYLQVVVNASAYATAVTFLPMAAGLIVASIVTGPWVARQGPRTPDDRRLRSGRRRHLDHQRHPRARTSTCATLGLGARHRRRRLRHHAGPGHLDPAGRGAPEHSGMAASVTNTSREMGAVFGVAVLGSIVNSKLTGQLAARLKAIGIPPNFQSLVIHAVTGGGAGGGAAVSGAEHSKNAAIAKIATKVVNAAYEAFGSGLHVALDISGVLLLIGAVVSVTLVHGREKERVTSDQPG